MKKIFAAALAALMLSGTAIAEYRAECGTVMAIDLIENTFKLVDTTGNVWEMKDPEDAWMYDVYTLLIDDKGTAQVEDDEILECKYSGINLEMES